MLFSSVFALTAIIGVFCARPALALDQDDRESLSRHGEASAEAFTKFGDAGETLTHISSRKFEGTGSQRRMKSQRLDAALEPWKKASASAKNSLSYKVLPHAFTVADEGMSMLGAAIEGDYRGAMGTAVSVAVEPSATAAAASVFGAIGTGIGATVGSFIPVVGTAGGAMVGGAIGTVAGGYICAVAYDIYVKEWVGKGVEGGIAGMIDVAPQQQAMRTRHEFLYAQAADDLKPHWDRLRAAGFGSGGVELIGPESTPYISIPKPPLPDPQQQAALPGGPSIGPGDIQILAGDTVTNCSIADDKMRCERSWILGLERWHWQFEGTINGSTVVGNDLTVHDVRFQTVNCGYRWRWSYQLRYDFEDGGRVRITASNGAISLVSNTCPVPPKSVLPPSYSGVVTWRARQ